MHNIRRRSGIRGSLVRYAATLAITVCCAQSAIADVTVVTDVTVTGLPAGAKAPAFPMSQTAYFQGDRSRVEEVDGTVLIFDNGSDQVYQLDTRAKTYRVESIKHLEDFKSALPPGMSDRVSINSDVRFDTTSGTATYLNVQSAKTDVSGETRIVREHGSQGGRAGGGGRHRRGGGGLGGGWGGGDGGMGGGDGGFGGEGGGMGRRSGRMQFPVYDVSGEIWGSEALKLPKGKHVIVSPLALQMAWDGAPFLNDLIKDLDKNHEIPLHSVLTVTERPENVEGDMTLSTPNRTITTTFDVKSISNTPCPPSLFETPAGYAKVDGPISLPQLASDAAEHARSEPTM